MRDYSLKFSHVGIYVTDLAKMTEFYSRILGFPVTDHGLLHGKVPITFLSRDPNEHHQIALISARPAGQTDSVINQISFRLPDLSSLKRLRARLIEEGVIKEGVTKHRAITHGNAWALYVHDPEGNQVELFVDSDWYISQPCSVPIDLDRPEEDILRESEAFCREQPDFQPIAAWRAEMAERIAAHDRA
ncbi:MAG: VOC family protein [Xanthobacteraceae bacterium]